MDLTPVNDFFSNIKDKLTNPFFGTLIFVWLTRNWILVYTIFNFDDNHNLVTKVLFIKKYLSEQCFWLELLINIGLTIIFMISGYLLVAGTKVLSVWIEYKVMPYFTDKVTSDKIVPKEDYEKVVDERQNYFKRYEEERNSVRRISDNYDDLQNNYNSLSGNYQTLTENFKKTSEEIEKNIKKIGDLQTEIVNKNSKIKNQGDEITRLKNNITRNDLNNIDTDFNDQVWQAIREFFTLPKDVSNLFHLIEETPGRLTFDRKHFNLQAYSGNIQTFLFAMQNAQLGHFINTTAVDKLIEFQINNNGRKFLDLLKLFQNFKTRFNYA